MISIKHPLYKTFIYDHKHDRSEEEVRSIKIVLDIYSSTQGVYRICSDIDHDYQRQPLDSIDLSEIKYVDFKLNVTGRYQGQPVEQHSEMVDRQYQILEQWVALQQGQAVLHITNNWDPTSDPLRCWDYYRRFQLPENIWVDFMLVDNNAAAARSVSSVSVFLPHLWEIIGARAVMDLHYLPLRHTGQGYYWDLTDPLRYQWSSQDPDYGSTSYTRDPVSQ